MAELELRMAGRTAGLFRRFRVFLDGVEVARLKQGEVARLTVSAGSHQLNGQLDWHSGEPLRLELTDKKRTHVVIEYAWLITDPWRRPTHPFKYKVR